jgi:hypothetical protein
MTSGSIPRRETELIPGMLGRKIMPSQLDGPMLGVASSARKELRRAAECERMAELTREPEANLLGGGWQIDGIGVRKWLRAPVQRLHITPASPIGTGNGPWLGVSLARRGTVLPTKRMTRPPTEAAPCVSSEDSWQPTGCIKDGDHCDCHHRHGEHYVFVSVGSCEHVQHGALPL